MFAVIVLIPAITFGVLIARAVRSDRREAVQKRADSQQKVVQLLETDLNDWLFSTGPSSARSHAVVRFRSAGDQVVFDDVGLSLPIDGAARPRPLQNAEPSGGSRAELLLEVYYPRVVVFLRDIKARTQYFQRIHAVVVRVQDDTGYLIDTEAVAAHANERLSQIAAATNVKAVFSIADARDNKPRAGVTTLSLKDYPFFQVDFALMKSVYVREKVRTQFRLTMANALNHPNFAVPRSNISSRGTLGTIERLDPAVDALLAPDARVEILAEDISWAEGPVYFPAGRYTLFSAISQEVRLSRLRTDFVSAVSHEFRSPLSSILALSERLTSARVTDPAKLAEYHALIGSSASRLSSLVTQLLDFAQIEQGKKIYSQEKLDLVMAARDAVNASRESITMHPIELESENAAPLWVTADRLAVHHCLHNLLENAAKYSPPGSTIRVTCAPVDGFNTIEVRDAGIGIAQTEQAKIFEKFYRGADAARLGVQGVGIGLALVKHMMESHHGSVDVRSAPGQGSQFRLSFPRAEG